MLSNVKIQIVTWNSKKHLDRLFKGIERQKGVDFSVLIIDNNSDDETVKWIEINKPNVKIIKNSENLGFAKAHNQGFGMCESDWVLVLNPDTELQDDFISELLKFAESNEKIGSVGGVLYRELPSGGNYGIIDSLGLKMHLIGKVSNINEAKPGPVKLDKPKKVFGITGACVMYNLKALKEAKDKFGIFDERFGSYKEDVDLAWRLNKKNWKSYIIPTSIALHERHYRADSSDDASFDIKYFSRRNHLLMLKKNLSCKDIWRIRFIIGYELAKYFHALIFERELLKAYKDYKKLK